jgi:DNA-directed RNA polymerase specialized sigma24 family protein
VVRTALNTHVTWWRRCRREVGLGDHDVAVPATADLTISSDLLTELRRLPLRQRQVVTLRLLLDLDTDSTAQILGIAPGTVFAHLHRAVAALRSAISEHDDQKVFRQ